MSGGPILVVEDDSDIRETLQQVLELEGYRVATAANGHEGLAALETGERPSLILLDLMMPVMSGAEMLDHLRTDERLADIPVVVVTAWRKEAETVTGVQGFIQKPVDLDELLGHVQRYA